jgi:hypothetical protein
MCGAVNPMSVSMFPFGQTVRDAIGLGDDVPPAFSARKNLTFTSLQSG